MRIKARSLTRAVLALSLIGPLAACGNHKKAAGAGGGMGLPPGGLPVKVLVAQKQPVQQTEDYVATIKSRRSATMTPQVDGNLVSISAHSGQQVHKGQLLMSIDPIKQTATLQSAQATEQQKLAVYQYNKQEVERQRKLFQGGITSRQAYDQAVQAFQNSKADYDSSKATSATQKQQLGYYKITAPFDGTVGDIPVHIGDYVSTTTMLTTVDADRDLEVYIYVPGDRSSEVHAGLPVNVLGPDGKIIERTKVDFISPQVDSGLQGILIKAPVHSQTRDRLRNAQFVKAQVVWSDKPLFQVPVLAVTQIGGQSFLFTAVDKGGQYTAHQQPVEVGQTNENDYSVMSGLNAGEKVIVSGVQILQDGMPVKPLGGTPGGVPPSTAQSKS